MAWSSFEKDKLLAEGWRKFLQEEEQIVFGINSEDNTESLLSFLEKNKKAIGLTPEQVNQLVALMLAQTKEDDVVLEAIGGPQRDARTFSSDTTTKLNALINTFDLDSENKKKLEKVLNRWAKLNTVTFEPGEAATPVMVTDEPDGDEETPTPAAEPKQTSRGIDYEPYGATGATPEKRADNLVVKPSSTDAPDEAETDKIEPVSSTEPAEQPAEKTVSTDTARPERGKTKTKEEAPSQVITRMLRGKGVNLRKINAFIEDMKALRKIEEARKPLLQSKLGLKNAEYKRFKEKHKEVITLINRLGVNKTKFIEAVAKLIAQPAPARQEPEAEEPSPEPKASREPAAATPAEPAQQAAPAPEPEPEPEAVKPEAPAPEPEAVEQPAPDDATVTSTEPEQVRDAEEENEDAFFNHGKSGYTVTGIRGDSPTVKRIKSKIKNPSMQIKRLQKELGNMSNEEDNEKLRQYVRGLGAYQDSKIKNLNFRPLFKNEKEQNDFISKMRSNDQGIMKSAEKGLAARRTKVGMAINSQYPQSLEDAIEMWNDLYDRMGEEDTIKKTHNYVEKVKPYLLGLKKYIESALDYESESKFLGDKDISDFTKEIVSILGESLMVRWKQLAGIL